VANFDKLSFNQFLNTENLGIDTNCPIISNNITVYVSTTQKR